MEALILAQIQYPGFLGDSIRVPSLAKELSRQGHGVHLFILSQAKSRETEITENKLRIRYISPIGKKGSGLLRKYSIGALYGRGGATSKMIFVLYYIRDLLTIIKSSFKLINFCKKHRIDILISYTPNRMAMIPTSLCKKIFKLPLIVDYSDRYDCDPFELSLLKDADRIAWITLPIKKTLESIYKINPKNLFYLPNGVDIDLFLKLQPDVKLFPGKKVVLFLGDLYSLDILIKAAPQIIDKNPDVLFLIIGDGKKPEFLNEIKNNIFLMEHFNFLGLIPHEKVPQYIHNSDVCVNTFIRQPFFEYALPLKIFEYMACGKPVVATKIVGTMEIVKHGYNGFLADPDDYQKFAEYINQLLGDSKLREEMGKNGRRTVKEFTWTKISKKLEQVMHQITMHY